MSTTTDFWLSNLIILVSFQFFKKIDLYKSLDRNDQKSAEHGHKNLTTWWQDGLDIDTPWLFTQVIKN